MKSTNWIKLRHALERLDIRDGDVLIVNDPKLCPLICQIDLKLDFIIPIIAAPKGNITKVSIEDLRKIVEAYDNRHPPEAT